MNLITKYDKNFKKLEKNSSRTLVLFNIRLRLALDIQVNFSGKSLKIKKKIILETYSKLIKLVELWNAYEAFIQYTNELGKYGNSKNNKAKIYSQSFLKEIGSLSVLKQLLNELKSKFIKDNNFKKDMNGYLKHIENDKRIGKKLTNDIISVKNYFENEKEISGIEILSLIYVERNMYYHNGETARMNMQYNNRKLLLDDYRKCLHEHVLILANHILNSERLNTTGNIGYK